jgi:hypothetical protein
MNVIAYLPFQDGGSADAVGQSDRAIASDAALKPTSLFKQSRVIGFLLWYLRATTIPQRLNYDTG